MHLDTYICFSVVINAINIAMDEQVHMSLILF